MSKITQRVRSALATTTGYELVRADRLRQLERQSRRSSRNGRPSQSTFDAVLKRLSTEPVDKMSLTDIANLHGSDKGVLGPTANWPGRNYTDVYEAFLAPLRHLPITLLEVGLGVPGENWEARIARGRNVGGGASLKAWYDYFPAAQIIGVDINPAPHLDNDRISTYVVDQGDRESLSSLLKSLGDVEFDVIVDDGSHRPDHQQLTLGVLFPKLKSGGLYIIEDLLSNGMGDGRKNRMASESVLNTRRVLKDFSRHGSFSKPNALGDEAYLASHIDQMTFHVPRNWWAENTESVCVIRKSPASA